MSPARRIEIVAYQETWAEDFLAIAASLRAALGALAVRIDHIGSTSVPGLGAKDVVDIQVTVADLSPAEPLAAAARAAGFELRPAICTDHRPPGDASPDAEWQKLYFREPPGTRRSHIHVRQTGRANQRYALLFRDFLRANRLAASGYEQTKRALARLHPEDIDAYLEVKDPVCDLIMLAAELWATSVSWQPGRSDA